MAYCPVVADANDGNVQIWGCEEDTIQPEKEDLLCCSGARDGSGHLVYDGSGTDFDGLFNCTEGYYGYMSNNTFSQNGTQMCIDGEESLTTSTVRVTPLCEDVA
jgi:hypothetical protein